MNKFSLLLCALFLIACQPVAVAGAYKDISPVDLNAALQNKDFIFVNVHIPFEGDIASTDLSIPFDQLTQPDNLALLPSDKDARIVLYCMSGRMSQIAANELVALGYTDVWNLDGGMIQWAQQGYAIQGR
ncbi:MAG: rhodanese-like domain-containing protein [Anaerolineales bacterium]